MVFGYLNRNYKEELSIPAGPDNKLEPGDADRGQPTYFLPRRQTFIFKVQVPADWGPQKELVWTVTAHGRTEKAYGQLTPEEEITERMIMTRGGLTRGVDDPNQPPSITIAPVNSATLTAPLTADSAGHRRRSSQASRDFGEASNRRSRPEQRFRRPSSGPADGNLDRISRTGESEHLTRRVRSW